MKTKEIKSLLEKMDYSVWRVKKNDSNRERI